MADGSYYEGEFKDGEIDGHGFRKWQHTGNCYSGEFCKYFVFMTLHPLSAIIHIHFNLLITFFLVYLLSCENKLVF